MVTKDDAIDAVKTLLAHIGEDDTREGLIDTPDRVLRAWTEITAGYHEDPAKILSRTFDVPCDEMIIVRGITFYSTCEHHLLPFIGEASVAYIPTDRVVGLSKIPRLVECFAKRLQVQERLTQEIAEAMMQHLNPVGVGVVIKAKHLCMGCRGVKQPNAEMVTSATIGAFRYNTAARAEFMALVT